MTPIRFAIWAAVSTKDQAADDKASLHVQEDECRRVATGKGWVESGGPYIVRGQSRTRWASLRDAENAIPELHAMLDAAQAREFDVLVLKDYDRFRDILDQVFRTINDYHVQLYSLAQPIDPTPPEIFDPEASDSQELLISFSQMRSRTEIRTTRRRYRAGMPERIKNGLAMQIPYGYRRPAGHETNRQAVPIQDPDIAPHLVAIKDLFLAGQSTRQLVEYLQAAGVPTPKKRPSWSQVYVREILLNPYYAGQVRFGVSKNSIDRRTGARIREDAAANQIITAVGKHIPLWDLDTHNAILDEFERRAYRYSGRRSNTLSGLLICGQCGKPMWLQYGYHKPDVLDPRRIRWHCSARQGHPSIKNTIALEQVLAEIKNAISGNRHPDTLESVPDFSDRIQELNARHKRITDGYDNGLYDIIQTKARIAPIEKELRELQQITTKQAITAQEAAQRTQLITQLSANPDALDRIILGTERLQAINHTLKQILSSVIIIDAETTKVIFK